MCYQLRQAGMFLYRFFSLRSPFSEGLVVHTQIGGAPPHHRPGSSLKGQKSSYGHGQRRRISRDVTPEPKSDQEPRLETLTREITRGKDGTAAIEREAERCSVRPLSLRTAGNCMVVWTEALHQLGLSPGRTQTRSSCDSMPVGNHPNRWSIG